MEPILSDRAREIEDAISQAGMPVAVLAAPPKTAWTDAARTAGEAAALDYYGLSPDEHFIIRPAVAWRIVFPLGREIELRTILRDLSRDGTLRADELCHLKTVVHYFSQELFGPLAASLPCNGISTWIGRPREDPDPAGGIRLLYEVHVVLVGSSRKALELAAPEIVKAATGFNATARFLKIDKLRPGALPVAYGPFTPDYLPDLAL